jgi:hypothetical protein
VRPAIPSLPRLSLEPVHQRGWDSVYAALAGGRIDTEQLRDLLVRVLPDADPLVFAVDVTTWPRGDAECSPERGYYYHPSRHSAGQAIIAGWAYQWIAQLGLERDSWTAPVDARRLHPLDDTDHTAAVPVRTLLERLPAGGPVPTATLTVRTTSTAPSPSRRGLGCIPPSSATPATAAVGHGRSCAGLSCASRSNASRPRHVRPRCCGCGGPALAAVISIWPGGPLSAGSTWK